MGLKCLHPTIPKFLLNPRMALGTSVFDINIIQCSNPVYLDMYRSISGAEQLNFPHILALLRTTDVTFCHLFALKILTW